MTTVTIALQKRKKADSRVAAGGFLSRLSMRSVAHSQTRGSSIRCKPERRGQARRVTGWFGDIQYRGSLCFCACRADCPATHAPERKVQTHAVKNGAALAYFLFVHAPFGHDPELYRAFD